MRISWIVLTILMAVGCSDDGGSDTPESPGQDMAVGGMDMDGQTDADDGTGESNDMSEADAANDMTMANCDVAPGESTEDGTAGEETVIGELVSYGTMHSIGFDWDIDGDANHDAEVRVRYRKMGACKFKEGMPLVRNDYAWFWIDDGADEPINNFAGSLMFLTPGTAYEVVLELDDPDGGSATRVVDFETRAIPVKPTGGRTLYVAPGDGGGEGTEAAPYLGIEAADAAAQPGDIVMMQAGTYSGTSTISTSGEPDQQRIVWQPAGDGDVVIEALELDASHVWLDGLTFVRGSNEDGVRAVGITEDIVITFCDFTGYHVAIGMRNREAANWTVTDNTIVGDKAEGVGLGDSGDLDGYGIHTLRSYGHSIGYNSVTRVGDGISGKRNVDIYGNDVWDVSDDTLTTDYSYSNVRVWGNRLGDAAAYLFSFQPQYLGPWYIIRNQMAGANYGIFKWRVQDRIVFVNNTFAGGNSRGQYMMKTISRNNLWVPPGDGGRVWTGRDISSEPAHTNTNSPPQWEPSWNTDVDYDGFDWGDSNVAFSWRNFEESYPDIESFYMGVGIEEHGVAVDKDVIFEDYFVPAQDGVSVPRRMLTLVRGTNAVDSGGVLPNLADFYEGAAPDLGAFEVGSPLPHYGPRTGDLMDEHGLYWAKH